MTATEELRRLLDERRVEWWEEDGHTLWYGESLHHAASAFSSFMFGENERVHLNAMVTPEQAVAATLGPGTCHPEEQYLDSHSDLTVMVCSECGVPTDDLEDCNFCPNCGRKVE